MKKIIIAGHFDLYGENNGGIAIYNQNLYKELKKTDTSVKVFGWSRTKKNNGDFTPIVVSKKLLGRKFITNLLLKIPLKRLEQEATVIVDRPDRVLPFYLKKNKVICVLHGSHAKNIRIKHGKLFGKIYDSLEKIALMRADKIISVSNENLSFYLKKHPFILNKAKVIPVGVNSDFSPLDKSLCRKKHGFSRHERIFLYVGRLEKEKQVDTIIEAFSNTNAKLVIAGDGREREALMNLASKKQNIQFLGMINHSDLPELINCADALVLNSKYEGLPTVILEALACGVPVISNAVGDIPTVIKHGKNGYLMDQLDFQNLDLNLSKECIKTAKEYSWSQIVKKLIGEIQAMD